MALWRRRDVRLLALALLALTILTRLPALVHPQPIDDEDVYSVVANAIVDGGRPYVDAVERKPPVLFWVYASVFAIGGEYNWVALHVTALAWVLLTMVALYVIAARWFGVEAGLSAAALYAVFQPWATWKDLAFNGEVLMNLPIVWAYAIAFAPARSSVRPALLVAGGALAAAFLLKQPAAIAAVPVGVYLLLPSYRARRGSTVRQAVVEAALLTLGFAALLAAVAAILQREGILADAYYWTITNHDRPQFFWTRALLHSAAFLGVCLPLVIGAAAGLRDADAWRGRAAERLTIALFIVVSAVGVSAGGRFYPHYYIQLIPPLALAAAPAFARLWRGARAGGRSRRRAWTVAAWLAVIATASAVVQWRALATQRASTESGIYVREHSSPSDRIFVWGQASRIYLDARRRPASRYINAFPLTGYVFGATGRFDTRDRVVPGAWEHFAADIAAHPPVFIVDVQSDPDVRYPIDEFPVLARLLADDYRAVARTTEGVIYRRMAPAISSR